MLPQFQDSDTSFVQMQNTWAKQLNPVLDLPLSNSLVLQNVSLVNGTTTVNHMLGRALRGWVVVRRRAAATIYDQQDTNKIPDKTLILVSNAAVSVDLIVF